MDDLVDFIKGGAKVEHTFVVANETLLKLALLGLIIVFAWSKARQ